MWLESADTTASSVFGAFENGTHPDTDVVTAI
jgi:hypothetical protein